MAELTKDELITRFNHGESLERADLSDMELEGVSLVGANLSRADLSGANLAGADLSDATLTNASLPEAFLQGAKLVGAHLRSADLDGANLSGTDLSGADLSRANLEGANLEGAVLGKARLQYALLADTNLGKADLGGANLRSCDLSDAYLGGARLASVDLRKATLDGANLEEADLIEADLRSCDLHAVASLEGALLEGAKVFGLSITPQQLATALVDWWDVGRDGDGTEREEGEAVGSFLNGGAPAAAVAAPAPPATPGARFFGEGDVLKNAELEFSADSSVEVRGHFENCAITLGAKAELRVGAGGLLRDCRITGEGVVLVYGRLLNRAENSAVTARVFVVGAGGTAVGTVQQPAGKTRFGFEPGCVLRLSIRG
jgi:uncharacterized protein YjbI with pentapeptide repeats